MSRKKKLIVAASTFGVALAIGFVMQNGDALASRLNGNAVAQTPSAPPQDVILATASTASIPDISISQAEQAEPVIEMIALTDVDIDTDALTPDMAPAIAQDTCEITMDAQALPMAMVSVSVNAPCNLSEYATFHHQGMMFKELLDENGQIDMVVPALAETAFFLLSIEGGKGSATSVSVPDFANYDRAVLQWQGLNAVQLHAREFGADYGSDGHIWAAAAGELDFVNPSNGGFLISLGDLDAIQPALAEVYTYPSGTAETVGTINLSVEAEVTHTNCAREVYAQSMQFGPNQDPEAIDLIMTMPDCDTVGEFLVLKNMLQNLTLAAR